MNTTFVIIASSVNVVATSISSLLLVLQKSIHKEKKKSVRPTQHKASISRTWRGIITSLSGRDTRAKRNTYLNSVLSPCQRSRRDVLYRMVSLPSSAVTFIKRQEEPLFFFLFTYFLLTWILYTFPLR